jgi:AcrR family transcriptional regulator
MAPKTPPKPPYHHGDLPAQLVKVVSDLIEMHGPEGFSVAEAARRAGVSSAAPYKHFKDRPELLRAVVSEAMDRLRASMESAAREHPVGSLESIAAIGKAYVDFAREGPGVFRLVFSLTEGHENAPELKAKGQACFAVVLRATAERLGLAVDNPEVQFSAYTLWTAVHGHSFLIIDRKTDVLSSMIDDHAYLMSITGAVLRR